MGERRIMVRSSFYEEPEWTACKSPIWADCERLGIAVVRARLASPIAAGINARHVQIAWLEHAERMERLLSEAQQLALAERSVNAAEASSSAAMESARTSGTSARAAMFSAFVSFLALVVAIAAYSKQP